MLWLRLKENYIIYWSNFFIFSDKNLEKRKIWIFEKLCNFGICGIQMENNDYLIWDIANYKQNLLTDIISATGKITVTGKSKTINLTDMSDCVLIKGSRNIVPWFDFTLTFLEDITHAVRNLYIARENSTKTKFVKVDKISNEKKAEVKEIFSNCQPVVAIQGDISEIQDLSFNNETDKNWNDIWNSLQWYLYNEGMRYNSLEKGSEVKEIEAKNEQVWFEMVENQKYQIVKEFVDKLNRLYNTNISFETIIEKNNREQKEKMEVNNVKDEMLSK